VKRQNLIQILALVTITAILAGCSNHEGNEWQRLVCEVESVNSGNPLLSAYLYVGADKEPNTSDDIYPIDTVPVTFYARPYSSAIVLPEDGVSSWFHVTNYDLIWHPGPNAPAEMTDFNVTNALCDARVPVNDRGQVEVLIADRVMKETDWYRELISIPGHSFTAGCELRFHGHETGNSENVTVEGGLMVTFYGVVNPD
jgi:hypothetical protein